MISRALEWHRIIDAKPTADTIDRRTAAITDLVKAYEDSKEWDVILGSIAGVVAGFEGGRPANANAVQLIYQTLHAKDSTIPQDLSDNALELRAAAATALGEIVSKNPTAYPSVEAMVVSITILSGLNLRPRGKEKHLKPMLDELVQASKNTLSRAQRMIRKRIAPGKELLSIDEGTVTDPAVGLKAATKAAKKMANEFAQQAAIDREELNVLWWLFAQSSTTFGASIESLPQSKAAFAIGAEIANLCMLPPPDNAIAFVRRASKFAQKAEAKRSLEKTFEDTDSPTWSLLTKNNDVELGKTYPAICPLSWLCSKLATTNLTTGWAAEFQLATGLEATTNVDVFTLAEQVLLERLAERIYSENNGG